MTSKTTKFYSTAIAAALVATAVVPAASAADVTATKGADGKYSVTVTADAESTVKVYESNNTTAVAEGTVAADGTNVSVSFSVTAGKTYTYKVTPKNGTEGDATNIIIPAEKTTAIDATKVVVTDSPLAGKDKIKISGLSKTGANEISIFKTADATTAFKTLTSAAGKTEATFTLTDAELLDLADEASGANKGKLFVKVKNGDNLISDATPVTFDLKVVSQPLTTEQTYSVNNTKAKDTVTISGVKAGETVKFYAKGSIDETTQKPKADAEPFQIQKVSKNGAVTITFKAAFTPEQIKDGVYATVTGKDAYESTAFAVTIAEETETSKDSTPGKAEPINLLGTKDTVKVTGVAPGATVSLYTAEADTTTIGTAKANKTGDAVIKVKDGFTADHEKNGVWYSVTNVESKESKRKQVDVKGEPVSEEVYVNPSNIAGVSKDTVFVYGNPGTTVAVYAAADITPAVEATETAPAKLAAVKDGAKALGTVKIGASYEAIVKIKGGLDAHISAGEGTTVTGGVYVVATEKGALPTVSDKIKVEKALASEVLQADDAWAVNAKGTTADTIYLWNESILKGDVLNLYKSTDVEKTGDNKLVVKKDAKPFVTTKVAAQGQEIALKVKKGFSTTGIKEVTAGSEEKWYVTHAKGDLEASAPIEVTVGPEVQTDKTNYSVAFVNNIDLKDTIKIDEVEPKAIVEVYKADGTTLAAKATAKEYGELVITLKEDFKKGDKVNVKVTNLNTYTSEPIEITVGDEPTATDKDAYINTNLVTLDDNGAKDATVTVANAQAGVIYTAYDKDGKALGTAKAAKNGILVVKLAKGTLYSALKANPVTLTARAYSLSESEKVEIYKPATTTNP